MPSLTGIPDISLPVENPDADFFGYRRKPRRTGVFDLDSTYEITGEIIRSYADFQAGFIVCVLSNGV
uniref:hypothetical protein n=1 Tax=Burkholderia anthina TaxID=179879 RepID=UPI001589C574|nr:hypothetical protein [Burkholderia anthina]